MHVCMHLLLALCITPREKKRFHSYFTVSHTYYILGGIIAFFFFMGNKPMNTKIEHQVKCSQPIIVAGGFLCSKRFVETNRKQKILPGLFYICKYWICMESRLVQPFDFNKHSAFFWTVLNVPASFQMVLNSLIILLSKYLIWWQVVQNVCVVETTIAKFLKEAQKVGQHFVVPPEQLHYTQIMNKWQEF